MLSNNTFRRWRYRAAGHLIVVTLVLFATTSVAAQDSEPAQAEPTPTPLPYVALPEVTARAEALANRLAEISKRLEASPTTEIASDLDALDSAFEDRLPLVEQQRVDVLRQSRREELDREWQSYRERLRRWESSLLALSQDLEREKSELGDTAALWDRSHDEAMAQEAPDAVIDTMDNIIERVLDTLDRVTQSSAEALTVLDRTARARLQVDEVLARLAGADSGAWTRALRFDSPPLWAALAGHEPADGEPGQVLGREPVSLSLTDLWARTIDYAGRETERLVAVGLVLLIATVVLVTARRRLAAEGVEEVLRPRVAAVAERPLSGALLACLLVALFFLPGLPPIVAHALVLLILVAWSRLVPVVVSPALRPALYALAGVFLVDRYGSILITNELGLRLMLLLEAGVGALVGWWGLRRFRDSATTATRGWTALGRRLVVLAALVFAVAVVANTLGAVRLAELLTRRTLASMATAMVLYPAALVVSALVIVIMRRSGPRLVRAVEHHTATIETWLLTAVHLGAAALWLDATLSQFGVAGAVRTIVSTAFGRTLQLGAATVSAAKVLTLIGVFVGTLLLSKIIRALLEHDVYTRFTLPRGVPNAVSTLVRYGMVALALVLAPLAAGVDFSNLAFIAGGLGVGIGFGLQNVVANFVSGLILAFERPIQRGDTIEVGTFFGNVKAIGIRSSTIRTFDGADVVLPNSDLVSSPVVNWTLSDFQRRKRLDIMVAHGADPHRVLELLAQCATAHPEVLDEPPPMTLFDGFAETGLRFRLLFWLPTKFALSAPSEIGLAIYDALTAEGIEMPIPRQRLELSQMDQD